MRIIELRASNFARLKAVAIRPDGDVVRITGKNSEGKTSVLRAIWTALEGRAVAPPRPIHEGAERAEISLDLGTLAITRSFQHGRHGEVTSSLTVTSEGNPVQRSPQALLDKLLGDLSFDPLAFARLPAKEQFARLRALVPGIDFDAISRARGEAYHARTEANRQHQTAVARASAIALPAGKLPAQRVDVSALVKTLDAMHLGNRLRASKVRELEIEEQEREHCLNEAEALRAKAAGLEAQAERHGAKVEALRADLPAEIDIAPVMAQIAAANEVNDISDALRLRREREQEALAAKGRSEMLTAEIEELDRRVATAVAGASLPAGLTLDAEHGIVCLFGRPFEAAGTAERITASAEVAMALNPKIRVMLLDEGSELDSAHLALLADLAEAHDYQIWITRVEEGERGTGFRIVDGSVEQGSGEVRE